MICYDVTMEINSNMIVWPGDPRVQIDRVNKLEEGASANVSKILMGLHTGTHVDAPYHFLENGKKVSEIPLERFFGPANVIEIPQSVERITAPILKDVDSSRFCERILFKTRNSNQANDALKHFNPDYVGVDVTAAEFLVQSGVRLVGIDSLSVAPFQEGQSVHEVLLKNEIIILEGLNLTGVHAGEYQLYCLPLKLGDAEGSPARVILLGGD